MSGSDDRTVRVWELLKKKQVGVFIEPNYFVNCVAIYSNSCFVVSGLQCTKAVVWDFRKTGKIVELKGHYKVVKSFLLLKIVGLY